MNKQLIHIVVSAKSGFGVLDKTTEKWFNPSDKKLLKEFLVDGEYDVEMVDNVGKNGKTYTNIVAIVGRGAAPLVPPVFNKTPLAPATKVYSKPFAVKTDKADTSMSKADWAAKDRSQLLGGLCHDAAALTAAAISTGRSVDAVLTDYKAMLDGVIKLREDVK